MSSGFILYSWIQTIIWKHFFQTIKKIWKQEKVEKYISKKKKKMIISNHSISQSNLLLVFWQVQLQEEKNFE